MKVLVVGTGAGSWQIRGRQLGAAIRACVSTNPTAKEWRDAESIVLVKRAITTWGAIAKEAGPRIAWDVLDVWQQHEGNSVPMERHISNAILQRDLFGVNTLICATNAMAQDLGGVYLPHHARPDLKAAPVRPEAKVVAYEGTPKYLGAWRITLEEVCAKLGLALVVNPPSLAQADIIVALRGGKWDGEVCRRWKSGVKYVNAIAAGRPVITQRCAAWDEILPPGSLVDSHDDLEREIRAWLPAEVRQHAYEESRFSAPRYALASIAGQYRDILSGKTAVAA